MRVCTRCKKNKEDTEFNTKKQGGVVVGLLTQCKVCRNDISIAYRQTERGKETMKRSNSKPEIKESKRRYVKSEKGKALQQRNKQKEWYVPTRDRAREKYVSKNIEKIKAHEAVHNATKTGVLPRANTLTCRVCKTRNATHYHHESYSKERWLDVIPVCTQCHHDIHRKGIKIPG